MDVTYRKYIKENMIKALRKKQRLEKRAVADRLGLPTTHELTSWENGSRTPDIVHLFQLCKVLGVFPHNVYPALFDRIVAGLSKPIPEDKFKLGREAFLSYLLTQPFKRNTYDGEDIRGDDYDFE